MVNINVLKGRERWAQIMEQIGIRCPVRENKMSNSMHGHSDKHQGAKSFTLASVKLDDLIKILKRFPYDEFKSGDDAKFTNEIQCASALFVECLETMYRGLEIDKPIGREERVETAEKVRSLLPKWAECSAHVLMDSLYPILVILVGCTCVGCGPSERNAILHPRPCLPHRPCPPLWHRHLVAELCNWRGTTARYVFFAPMVLPPASPTTRHLMTIWSFPCFSATQFDRAADVCWQ